jgi:ElaB/YqjD/DUF883 family membrane-anchored ribosome-binding protein
MTDAYDIGGLLAMAEENQKAVKQAVEVAERAGQRLERAAQRWEETGSAVVRACGAAIGEAVTRESQTLAARIEAPFVAPVQRIQGAAVALQHAVRTIAWTWIAIAFLLGMLAGMGLLWWGMQPRLNRLLEYANATYEQTAPKMPTAPANVVPKKGGK